MPRMGAGNRCPISHASDSQTAAKSLTRHPAPAHFIGMKTQPDNGARDTCLRREGRGYGRQAATAYLDTRLPSIGSEKEGPLKVPGKPEIREYNSDKSRAGAMFVLNDEEIGIF